MHLAARHNLCLGFFIRWRDPFILFLVHDARTCPQGRGHLPLGVCWFDMCSVSTVSANEMKLDPILPSCRFPLLYSVRPVVWWHHSLHNKCHSMKNFLQEHTSGPSLEFHLIPLRGWHHSKWIEWRWKSSASWQLPLDTEKLASDMVRHVSKIYRANVCQPWLD